MAGYNRMTNPQPKPDPSQSGVDRTQIEAPAIITPLHRQDRAFRNDGGQLVTGQVAWSKLTHVEAYFDQGRLAGGNPAYGEGQRFAAAQHYAKLYLIAEPSGTDSTQALNISRSMSTGSANTARTAAGIKLAVIHSHLGQKDRQIIEMVCGRDYSPAEAVRTVCGDYRDTVAARFREALDALVEALEQARRNPKIINMEVRG